MAAPAGEPTMATEEAQDWRLRPMREKYPAFEFLMRHFDDAPHVGHSRHLQDVALRTAETAVGFALVGEVAAATRLIELLRSKSFDLLADACTRRYPFLRPCMYFAWEATDSWPDWIPAEERTEKRLLEMEREGRQPWLERFTEPWKVDRDTADKALKMANAGINRTFPPMNPLDRVELIDYWFKEGEYGYAANPNGPFSSRYFNMQRWWSTGMCPQTFIQVYRSAGLVIALDILLRLGEETQHEVDSIFNQLHETFTFEERASMLSCSRIAWKKILTRPDAPLANALSIDRAKMCDGTQRAIGMLETRLRDGPSRPYKDKTIRELVHIISANTFDNCRYDYLALDAPGPYERSPENWPSGIPMDERGLRVRPRDRDGLLHPPCPAWVVAELEEDLGAKLPDGYKEFLSVTNGMDPIWDGGFLLNIFAPAQEVCERRDIPAEGRPYSLLREDDPPLVGGNGLADLPEMPENAILLSGVSSMGDLYLLDRETTAEWKDYLFKQHRSRRGAQRRELERVVKETYGSMECFWELDRALICYRWWMNDMEPFDSFRGLLEVMAEKSMRRSTDRFWLDMFEPEFQRVSKAKDVSKADEHW